ncbi:MAG: hypothetical protein LH468_02205 [Nocardioides sp.]|nr:hypothetical protein [Nocardioides sp.]
MRAILLPGRAYSADMPLLHDAGRSLREHGHDVHPVRWQDPELTEAFVRRRAGMAGDLAR